MNIFTYQTKGGKDLVLSFLDRLTLDEQAEGYYILEMLENYSYDILHKLNTRQIQSKLWEIKFCRHNRLYYVVFNENDCYLVHACRKQKGKAELNDIRIAKLRMN